MIVASFASHLHRVRQVAEAAVNAGRKVVFLGRSMVNNVALGREMGMLDIPVEQRDRHRRGAALRARRGVHHLHRLAGRADERAVAHGRARAQAREDQQRRRRRDLRARDPGQRDQRDPHHRLAAPRRRRGAARRQLAGARVGPRVAGRAQDAHQHRAARVVRARARRVHAHGPPRRASPRRSASPRTTCSSPRTATCSRSSARRRPNGIEIERRAVPAGLPLRRRHRRRRRPGRAARPSQPGRGGRWSS